MTNFNVPCEALYSKMWRTRGARFVSRDRYLCINILSISCVSILSVYVIILSVISIIFQKNFTDMGLNTLNALNISISVAILAFGLIEGSRDHLGKSESMNNCALAIGRLYDEFSVYHRSNSVTKDVLEETTRRYSDVLDKYSLNHSSIDYEKFLCQHPDNPHKASLSFLLMKIWKSLVWWLQTTWVYIFGVMAPPLVVWIIFHSFWTSLTK